MRVVRIRNTAGGAGGDEGTWAVLEEDRLHVLSDAPWLGGEPTGESLAAKGREYLAPCRPGKIIAVAVNYPGATGLKEGIKEPLVFLKSPGSVTGPGQTIRNFFKGDPAWGECELGIVIGRTLMQAGDREASGAVFGYTIANDVTVENCAGRDHHLARSKAADTFCPVGPWVDSAFVPAEQLIEGLHNGELLRRGRLSERLHREPHLLAWLSQWMCLDPGDLVLTGAPTRVRDRIYFSEGDSYTCRIEGLGELTNYYSGEAG